MKKIALFLGVLIGALALSSCATKGSSSHQAPAVHSEAPQTKAAEQKQTHHKHYDYKGESLDK